VDESPVIRPGRVDFAAKTRFSRCARDGSVENGGILTGSAVSEAPAGKSRHCASRAGGHHGLCAKLGEQICRKWCVCCVALHFSRFSCGLYAEICRYCYNIFPECSSIESGGFLAGGRPIRPPICGNGLSHRGKPRLCARHVVKALQKSVSRCQIRFRREKRVFRPLARHFHAVFRLFGCFPASKPFSIDMSTVVCLSSRRTLALALDTFLRK
jgi:hypothetical protein